MPEVPSSIIDYKSILHFRCLVHVVRSANVRYSKVRPLHPLCQFDVCRHEVRYGCQREDSCSFAHSVIELKCWVLQQDTGGWKKKQTSQQPFKVISFKFHLFFHGYRLIFNSGITHEEMVQESKRHWQRLEQNAQKHQKVRQDEHSHSPHISRLHAASFCI